MQKCRTKLSLNTFAPNLVQKCDSVDDALEKIVTTYECNCGFFHHANIFFHKYIFTISFGKVGNNI